MGYILNIDTATDVASVCISDGNDVLGYQENSEQREHASFIHSGIAQVLAAAGIGIRDISAIAITAGPGSYTGLRVGMATAKGFCYALDKPLITFNTLKVMAFAARKQLGAANITGFCPMIDARRMEVFTGLYDSSLNCIESPKPVVLDNRFMQDYLKNEKIAFFGSGSSKFREINEHPNSTFFTVVYSAKDMAVLAAEALTKRNFSEISYTEPEYLKAFFNVAKPL